MKWQAIANVTSQINEEAKHYLSKKLQKDAAAVAPKLWSEFLIDINGQLHDAQNSIEIEQDKKTGGLAAKVKFDELHQDYKHNGRDLTAYVMDKYDQHAASYLSRSTNPYIRQSLQEKIGAYKANIANKMSSREASLIDGKRYNMTLSAIEKLKSATYDNPDLYRNNMQQIILALEALELPADQKQELLTKSQEQLSEAASIGMMNISPESFLNGGSGSNEYKADLSLSARIRLENRAASLLNHKQRMVQNQVKSIAPNHFASILNSGKGIDGFNLLLESSFKADDATYLELKEKQQLYQQAHTLSSQLKDAPLFDGAKILEQIVPKSGDSNYLQKEKIHQILVKQFNEHIKLASNDPARFVEELFTEDFNLDMPLMQRLLLRKQLQKQKGLPDHMQKYLMAKEREEYSRRLEGDDANKIAEQLDSIIAIGGGEENHTGNYQLGIEILEEITKDRKLNTAIHFYAENHLYANADEVRRSLANNFAKIIPIENQLFSSISSKEKRELEEAIAENKSFKLWQDDMSFQQPHNVENIEIMRQGLRTLARFYQLNQGIKPAKAVRRAADEMIGASCINPIDGLHVPKQIVEDGRVHVMDEEYINRSLSNLQRSIIKGELSYSKMHSFGFDYNEDLAKEKIKSTIADGRWFLSPDHKSVYYAFPLFDGSYHMLMLDENNRLEFKLTDLNMPEPESSRQQRLNDELMETISLMQYTR